MFELGIAVRRFERVDSQTVLLDVLCDLHSADGVKHFPFATQVDFAQESDAVIPVVRFWLSVKRFGSCLIFSPGRWV